MKKTLSVLLAACIFLAACTQGASVPSSTDADENYGIPSWLLAAIPVDGPCGNPTFVPGDFVYLGASGEDFHASLATYGGSLAGATLIVSLVDADLQLSATSLPSDGKTAEVGWGSYVSVQIANCAGTYHYQTSPLKVVERPSPSACSRGYDEGLKPYPFSDSVILFENGDEQVILATNSSPQGALIHTLGDQKPEVTTFDRGQSGSEKTETVKIHGANLQVSIKTCGVSFFFNAVVVSDRH